MFCCVCLVIGVYVQQCCVGMVEVVGFDGGCVYGCIDIGCDFEGW